MGQRVSQEGLEQPIPGDGIGGLPGLIVGFLKVYQELSKGHLERCIRNLEQYCDEIVAVDDSSTDGSFEYLRNHCTQVIRLPNEYKEELQHKQALLEVTLSLKPDWIVWLDPDEILDRDWTEGMESKLGSLGRAIGSVSFNYIQLWRSTRWRRLDELWAKHWERKVWRARDTLRFPSYHGLHHWQYPDGTDPVIQGGGVLHYGFSTQEDIVSKYRTYKSHGQEGMWLWRIAMERERVLMRLPDEIYPATDIPPDEPEPPALVSQDWKLILQDPTYPEW